MVWTVTGILLLGFFTYLLLMPLELCLDSYRGRYYLRMGFMARVSVEQDPMELLKLHLKVLFFDFFWRPSDIRSWGSRKKKSTKKNKDKGGKGPQMTLARGIKLLKSFRIKTFRLELDTGNPVLNARLFPLFFLLQQRGGDVGINFAGRNGISVEIANRPIYILNAFINLKK